MMISQDGLIISQSSRDVVAAYLPLRRERKRESFDKRQGLEAHADRREGKVHAFWTRSLHERSAGGERRKERCSSSAFLGRMQWDLPSDASLAHPRWLSLYSSSGSSILLHQEATVSVPEMALAWTPYWQDSNLSAKGEGRRDVPIEPGAITPTKSNRDGRWTANRRTKMLADCRGTWFTRIQSFASSLSRLTFALRV